MMIPNFVLLLLLTWLDQTHGTVYNQYNDSLPSNISATCYISMTTNLACSPLINSLAPHTYYLYDTLISVCTSSCNDSLTDYQSKVDTGCIGENFGTVVDETVPLSTIPQMLKYLFDFACVKDSSSGEYCNVGVTESLAPPNAPIYIRTNTSNSNDTDCSDCCLKSLQLQAGAEIYNDPAVVAEYSSLTSSCRVTDYPIPTPTFSNPLVIPSPTLTSQTCAGRQYQIRLDDTCASISKSQKIGTIWLILDNALFAYCSKFPTSATLCLNHPCTTHTVAKGDTCKSIQRTYGLAQAQVRAWNSQLDMSCSNIHLSVRHELYVSSPGTKYVNPSPTTIHGQATITIAASVPTNAANGTVKNCAVWYEAVLGDYCSLVTLRHGIDLDDFRVLNPEVNENCTNMFAYSSYCMVPVGDISNYPGAFGYLPPISTTWSRIPFSLLPTATRIYIPWTPPATPTNAPGTRSNCGTYANGSNLQIDVEGTFYANQCEELRGWNPSLGDQDIVGDCSFKVDTYYCVELKMDVASTSTSAPTTSGTLLSMTMSMTSLPLATNT